MSDEIAAAEGGAGPLVMKFGGTSVQDAAAIRRLAAIVRGHAAPSAMGSTQWKWLQAITSPPLAGMRSLP